MNPDFSQYYEAREPGRRERAYGWATAIGLQAVDGLVPSANLIETARRNIEGEITAAEARKIVDAYYETKLGHDAPNDEKEADKVVTKTDDVAKKRGTPLSSREEMAALAIQRDPRLSAAGLASLLDVSHRQAQRIIAALKAKAGLQRHGARKNGEWRFVPTSS